MALFAEKGNKALSIQESEAKSYQVQGFDIVTYDDKGVRTVKLIGHGKTVPYTKYVEDTETLKKQIAELEDAIHNLEDGYTEAVNELSATAKKKLGIELPEGEQGE